MAANFFEEACEKANLYCEGKARRIEDQVGYGQDGVILRPIPSPSSKYTNINAVTKLNVMSICDLLRKT
jgi:hypothetical protein